MAQGRPTAPAEPWPEAIGKAPEDGREYELHYRLAAVDPLQQRTVGEMWILLFKDGHVAADDTYALQSNYYFRHEMRLLLKKAGFTVVAVKGDWTRTTDGRARCPRLFRQEIVG